MLMTRDSVRSALFILTTSPLTLLDVGYINATPAATVRSRQFCISVVAYELNF